MKLGRTCAAAAMLGALALPMTAGVSSADTASERQQDESSQRAEREAGGTRASDATPEPGEADAAESRRALDEQREPAEQRRGQVDERPVGAPDTGGGPVEWDSTPAYVAGVSAAVVVAGVGTVLVVRRRHAGQR